MFRLEIDIDSGTTLEFNFLTLDQLIEFLIKEKYLYKMIERRN